MENKINNKLATVVDEDIIEETKSEKLLDNKLTWREHLHGNNENEGLKHTNKEKGRKTL